LDGGEGQRTEGGGRKTEKRDKKRNLERGNLPASGREDLNKRD